MIMLPTTATNLILPQIMSILIIDNNRIAVMMICFLVQQRGGQGLVKSKNYEQSGSWYDPIFLCYTIVNQ